MSRVMTMVFLAAVAIAAVVFIRFAQTPNPLSQQQEQQKQWELLEFQNWHEFAPPSQKFKVLFPTLPQRATEKLGDPSTKEARIYDMYVAQKENGDIFMISLITLLDKPTKKLDESMLSSVVNNMLSASPKTKVNKMQMGSYNEYPSIDFSLENEQAHVNGKAFMVGNTLYLLTSATKQVESNRQEFDFFVNSFQLMPAGKDQI